MTVTAVTAGVIANLTKDRASRLCDELQGVPALLEADDIPTTVGDLVLVPPGAERGRRGFEGTLKWELGRAPIARWKPRGFRLFGQSAQLQDSSQAATMVLLLHVMGGLSPEGRAILAGAALFLGHIGSIGEIGLRNHGFIAATAVDQATEAVANAEAE